jgi:hypothetical protein
MSWAVDWQAVTGVATVILAGATIVLAAGIPLGLRRANRTLNEQRYAHFSNRYERIISHLPYNIFAKDNGITQVDEKTKVWLIAYIDLCAEELFDRQRKAIDRRVWEDWALFIVDDFKRSTPLLEVFNQVKGDYPYLAKFLKDGEVPPLSKEKARPSPSDNQP